MTAWVTCLAVACGAVIALPGTLLTQGPVRGDTVRATVELVIGELEANASHEFGFVSGVVVDDEGRMYVADRLEATVLVFGPDGRLIERIGRKGDGPGEFNAPTGPVLTPDGGLIVRTMERAARFAKDPASGLASKYQADMRYPGYADWMSTRASRVDEQGRFSFPGYLGRRGEPVQRFVLRYDREGKLLDTLHVPLYPTAPQGTAFIPTSPNGGRMVHGLNTVPFAPAPVWDITLRGTIISGDGRTYELVETDVQGTIVRRFTRAVPPARIDASERRDSLRALERRIDTLPVPIANVIGVSEDVKERRLPDVYPAYIDVIAATDGRIWVRRWPPPRRSGETFFDVFERDGRFRGTVVLPVHLAIGRSGSTPFIGDSIIAGVIIDPDTDTHSVVRLRFSLPSR